MLVLRLVLLSLLLFFTLCDFNLVDAAETEHDEDEYYDDEYYEDGYEDEIEIEAQGTSVDISLNGYHTNVGGGVNTVKMKLINDVYLNETAKIYDCLIQKQRGAFPKEKKEEEDEEEDEEDEKEGEGNSDGEDSGEGSSKLTLDEMNELIANGTDLSTLDQKNKSVEEAAKKKKKLTYREKQKMEMEERRKKQAEKEALKPKFLMGASCETLICGSCKALVEQFAHRVVRFANDPEMKYIEDLTKDFCDSREVNLEYVDMVPDLCGNFNLPKLGYKEVLVSVFEDNPTGKWDKVMKWDLFDKQEKICTTIGFCSKEQFQFQDKPQKQIQEHWDENCFVCQRVAVDIEEALQLKRTVTETNVEALLLKTCDRLLLPGKYDAICRHMLSGRTLSDLTWLGKVHSESMIHGKKAEQTFEDKLCEEIDYCVPWKSTEDLQEEEEKKQIEEVFY